MSESTPTLASFKQPYEYRNFIARYLDAYCAGKEKIDILCIGSLHIDEYLSGWLEAKSHTDLRIRLHVLRDKYVVNQFSNRGYYPVPEIFDEIKKYKELSSESEELNPDNKIKKQRKITYKLEKINLDHEVSKHLDTEYDIIINFYLLHNSLNWRLLIINLFDHLKDGGLFLFPEVRGNSAVVDGNFKDAPEEIADGLKLFDELRNNNHYFWRPELSLTNYTQLKNQIEFLFEEIIDKESINSEINWENGIIDIEINKGYTFKRLIEDRIFSYFNIGITKEETKQIVEQLNKHSALEKDCILLNRHDQVYLCKGFNKKRFSNFRQRHWNYTPLLKDIDDITDNNMETLARKAIDVFISHDIFFPGYTQSIAFITWPSHIGEEWTYPMTLVSESEEAQRKFYARLALFKMSFCKLLNVLFKESPIKFPLYISSKTIDNTLEAGFTVLGEEEKKIAYAIEKTRKGKIEHISIIISPGILNDIIEENKYLYKDLQDITDNPEVSEQTSLRNGAIRSKINKPKNILPLNEKVGFKSSLSQKQFEPLLKTLQGILPLEKQSDYIPTGVSLLEWTITLTVLFGLNENGRIAYIPSSIVSERPSQLNISIASLGGLILSEALPDQKEIMTGLFAIRDKALEEAVNLVFNKASINSRIDKAFYQRATVSAIGAITARSGSHTLGSHVLPEVGSKLIDLIYEIDPPDSSKSMENILSLYKDHILSENNLTAGSKDQSDIKRDTDEKIPYPTDDIEKFCKDFQLLKRNTKYLSNERELFKYLQERLDFITQIVGDLPQWTLSLNYIGDLLKNFYQQYHILNSLGDTEGITAYCYNTVNKNKAIEKNWFEDNNHEEIVDNSNIIIYSHCVPYKGKLVFVSSKTHAAALLKGKSNLDDPKFPVFICEDDIYYTRTKTLNQVLQDGYKSRKFYAQKIKVGGVACVDPANKNKILLTKCEIYGNRLAIKARMRKYFLLENNEIIEHSNYSRVLSKEKYIASVGTDKDTFVDIARKVNDNMSYEYYLTPTYFFGVIQSINRKKKVTTIQLCAQVNTSFEISTKVFDSINSSPYPSGKKIQIKKKILCVGARVVLRGYIEKTETNRFRIVGENAPLPSIEEISFTDYLTTTSSVDGDESDNISDIQVAIPGGTVGTQAFYIILENIIRNAAKHNWVLLEDFYKAGKNLEVKIELEDHNNQDYFICKIWTNTTDIRYPDAIPFKGDEIESYLHSKKTLNSRINSILKDTIIADDGNLKRENLGLSEIKICTAFLAKHEWITRAILSGDNILLNDKVGGMSDGYIKCSMILEEDAGELCPRLGYRLKLQKPKEIVIVGKTVERFDGSWNYGISFIDEVKKEQGVDYQFCVLFADDQQDQFANRIIRLVDAALEAKTSDTELMKEWIDLSCEIENYPCRLFLVTDNAGSLKWKPLLQGFNITDNINKKLLGFFRKRICFVKKNKFLEHLRAINRSPIDKKKSKVELFKNYLYEKWYHMFTSKNHNYELIIQETPNEETKWKNARKTPLHRNLIYLNKTVPLNLRQLNDRIPDRKPTRFINREDRHETNVIKYSRHDNEKLEKDPRRKILYSEGFSGTSRVFSLLKNYSKNDKNFKCQLVENGLITIMILDERVANYVHAKTANDPYTTYTNQKLFNVFQHLNIIVPYKLEINSKVIYEADIDIRGIDGEVKKIILCENENKAIVYFKQPSHTGFRGNYRVNSLVIHQTILDHFSKALYPNPSEEGLKPGDNVILKLKHEYDVPCVIITSGRGRSLNSSKFAKFMPFSNISNLLLRRDPDKYTLTQILLQSLNLPNNE